MLRSLLSLLGVLILGTTAVAQSYSFGRTCDGLSDTVSITRAASPTSLKIEFDGVTNHGLGWENLNPNGPSNPGAFAENHAVFEASICGQSVFLTGTVYRMNVAVGPFDSVIDYAGTSGVSTLSYTVFDLDTTTTNSTIIGCLTGTGSQSASISCLGWYNLYAIGNSAIYSRVGMSGTFTATVQ